MFDFGGIASSVLDFADQAVSSVLGGLSTAGSWMQNNPGAATLLGSALVAGGSYMENRDALKEQRKLRDEEWQRQDTVFGAPMVKPMEFQVTPGLAGDAMVQGGSLTNGVLANIKKNNQNKQGVN
ncbi:hypothetical protein HQ397_04215 [Aeromonas hydrophila]|uniref:hypothetical protein n=1 Tax=Aeromonas hydrophila TaxID=644 RepID=UPI001C746147|nr:hypothetical protein [Aeromonas hydrophila]QWL69413.1 hypothetical protein HQ397_04215 [Aeromonas hydrophila]